MNRYDLIIEGRRALRTTSFTNKPLTGELTLDLKGKAAAEYLEANPIKDLKTKSSKKAATAPKGANILIPPVEDNENTTDTP